MLKWENIHHLLVNASMTKKEKNVVMSKITDKIVTTINLNKQENPPKLIV